MKSDERHFGNFRLEAHAVCRLIGLDTLVQRLLRGRNSHPGGRWSNHLRGEALRQVMESRFQALTR